MNDQSRVFFGIVLCVVFYFSYTKYLQNKYPETDSSVEQISSTVDNQANRSSGETSADKTSSNPSTLESSEDGLAEMSSTVPKAVQLSPEKLSFETANVVYKFDQASAGLSSIELQNYFEAPVDAEGKEIEGAAKVKRELLDSLLVLEGIVDMPSKASGGFSAKRIADNKIEFSRKYDESWLVRQTYEFSDPGYQVQVQVDFQNTSSKNQNLVSKVLFEEKIHSPRSGGGFLFPTGMYDPWQWRTATSDLNDDIDREDLQSICDPEKASIENQVLTEGKASTVSFVGLDSRYFVKLLQPKAKAVDVTVQRAGFPKDNKCNISSLVSLDQGSVKPQQTVSMNFNAYFGPKDSDVFQQGSDNFSSSLYLGWIAIIAKPLMKAIHFIYKGVGNYGLAIIIATLLLKILFFPLTRQAAVSAHKMKKIQPIMKELQKKYKDDRQKMQLELIKVYKEHKINPAKSCLPILPTIPVFLAFYQVLMYSIDLRQAPFIFWIQDLSQKDPTFITPILLGGLMVIQMKMTPNVGMDKAQQNIMMVMPIVFTFAMISLPAGLVVYMVSNTIFTIIQQKLINRSLGD